MTLRPLKILLPNKKFKIELQIFWVQFEIIVDPTRYQVKMTKIKRRLYIWGELTSSNKGDLVVTLNENHQIIHLFKIIKILNKFKILKYHWIGKFSNIINLRKLDFLSKEKINERSRFVNLFMCNLAPCGSIP